MIEEIHFILHVVNGIHIMIHFKYCFRNTYLQIAFFKTLSMIYNMSSLSKFFSSTYNMFEVLDGNSFSPCFKK